MTTVQIRPALAADFRAIQSIYADEVLNGIATFEEIPPSIDELTQRWSSIIDTGLPFLVATLEQKLVGFAYASPYRFKPAYRFTIESSVYVSHDHRHQGIGQRLMQHLIKSCSDRQQMIAVVSDSENPASIALHQSLGFVKVGRLERVGFKHDQWIDTLLLQRSLP